MWRLVYCNLFVNINYIWSFLIRSADYFVDVVGISLKEEQWNFYFNLAKDVAMENKILQKVDS